MKFRVPGGFGVYELRSSMDRVLAESASGEGTDGEAFLQGMLEDLDRKSWRKAG